MWIFDLLQERYLLFHTTAEGFAVVIAFCIFLLAMGTYRFSRACCFVGRHTEQGLTSDAPAPGGGSAAALAGALAAFLTAMVANLTRGRKKFATLEEQMVVLATAAGEVRCIKS